jgi:ABC-type polar amino acid transport system ATPase subunit
MSLPGNLSLAEGHMAPLSDLDKVRGDAGMVFQSLNLFPRMTVMEN